MTRATALLLIAVMPALLLGDAHTTDSSGLFSAAATWTGDSLPIAGDTWTISTGNSVYYDITAATDWGTDSGTAITINGTLWTGRAVDANNYNLKASGNIVVGDTGTWTIGTSRSVPLVNTATFTITMDGAFTISDTTSGVIGFYCKEPTNKVILLSADEAIGQTELSVATDITGDIWADGDTVSICDLQGDQEHETRVIAAGGRSADHIDVTAGLTAAKEGGVGDDKAQILRVTRNIKIIGGSGASQVLFSALDSDTIDAWGYCATAAQGYGFSSCTNCSVGGYWGVGPTSAWATGWPRVFFGGSGNILSGTASGNTYILYTSSNGTVSGTASGNGTIFYTNSNNGTVSGTASGNTNVFSSSSTNGIVSGTASGNTNIFSTSNNGIVSGTASGNTSIFYFSNNGVLIGANITSGTYCWRRSANCLAWNSTIATTTEEYEFTSIYVQPDQWIASYNHDASAGAFKSVTMGGNTLSATASPPSGFTTYFTHTCASATYWNFRQERATIRPGQGIRVWGWIKQDATDLSAGPPKIEIIDQFADPLVSGSYSALASCNIPVSNGSNTDWQAVSCKYTNTGALAKPVFIRASAKSATAVVSEVFTWDRDHTY